MKYSIGQYSKTEYSTDNQYFLTLNNSVDYEGYFMHDLVSESTEYNFYFANPVIRKGSETPGHGGFGLNNKYYVHAHVQALETDQEFNVVLMNFDDSQALYEEQIVYTFRVAANNSGTARWAEVEFSFNPYKAFSYLCFQLQRQQNDYQTIVPRIPAIKILELSEVKDILHESNMPIDLQSDETIIKIGIHANPGFKMFINNSELMVGKSGIYELHNPIIEINSFSVVAPLRITNTTALKTTEENITNDYNREILYETNPTAIFNAIGFTLQETGINSHFSNPNIHKYSTYDTSFIVNNDTTGREIPAFTFDYVRKKDEGLNPEG